MRVDDVLLARLRSEDITMPRRKLKGSGECLKLFIRNRSQIRSF